jgi:hypothetical protein
VLIGKVTTNLSDPDTSLDNSIMPKKGQLGVVDKTFMTEGQEGFRLAKVRIREERVPAIGDKFCSRCGQKGTIGLVIPGRDMPFTEDGVKPDLIINPHALPSRMTIGQLVETLMGKACLSLGGFGDCTAFVNKGPKNKIFGEVLTDMGYHSSGNQILYNGTTGEQLSTEIFMGPTYYMRLKHMVKDKINYRAQGPRTVLTRQTVQGRANDGGLRIGEMERDAIISHGMTAFLKESMLERGDDYYMAVCNQTGTIAVYNESQNLFISPMADGPIEFTGNLEDGMNIVNVTRYGRNFSIVRVPYSFKLLMQELGTMNIQMRLITEANVDQLTGLIASDNIEKLTHKPGITPKKVRNMTTLAKEKRSTAIQKLLQTTGEKHYEEESSEPEWMVRDQPPPPSLPPMATWQSQTPPPPPEPLEYGSIDASGLPPVAVGDGFGDHYTYEPTSPGYSPHTPPVQSLEYAPQSPQYPPPSPQYAPQSPQYPPPSPQYSPHSPQYSPHSPQYSPHSPQYAPPPNVGYGPVSSLAYSQAPEEGNVTPASDGGPPEGYYSGGGARLDLPTLQPKPASDTVEKDCDEGGSNKKKVIVNND